MDAEFTRALQGAPPGVSRLALSTAAGGVLLLLVALSLGLALAGRIVMPLDALARVATAMRTVDHATVTLTGGGVRTRRGCRRTGRWGVS